MSHLNYPRMARSDEIAAAVKFLVSDESSYITGVDPAVSRAWRRSNHGAVRCLAVGSRGTAFLEVSSDAGSDNNRSRRNRTFGLPTIDAIPNSIVLLKAAKNPLSTAPSAKLDHPSSDHRVGTRSVRPRKIRIGCKKPSPVRFHQTLSDRSPAPLAPAQSQEPR